MTTLQSFIYYQNYPNDPPSLRYLVSTASMNTIRALVALNKNAPPGPHSVVSMRRTASRLCESCLTLPWRLFRILETVHTAFCMQFVYAYIIQGFTSILSFIPIVQSVLILLVAVICVTDITFVNPWLCSGVGVSGLRSLSCRGTSQSDMYCLLSLRSQSCVA